MALAAHLPDLSAPRTGSHGPAGAMRALTHVPCSPTEYPKPLDSPFRLPSQTGTGSFYPEKLPIVLQDPVESGLLSK